MPSVLVRDVFVHALTLQCYKILVQSFKVEYLHVFQVARPNILGAAGPSGAPSNQVSLSKWLVFRYRISFIVTFTAILRLIRYLTF